MKRIAALICSLLLSFCLLSGCTETKGGKNRLSVVCTIFPQYDIVRQIAGDSVELNMLLPYGMESHDFKLENLSVKDLALVAEADIIISVGGGSDSIWVNELREKVGNSNQVWAELCDFTETLCTEEHDHENGSEPHDSHEHFHEHSHEHLIDEHIWTSPKRMRESAVKIADILISAEPVIADICNEGLSRFTTRLGALDIEFAKLGAEAQKPAIFADRFSFRYLFHDYGLEYVAAFTGCSSSVDPSVLQITEITQRAIENSTNTIFYMENSNTKYAKKIAESVGAKPKMLHSCHNISKQEMKNGADYISLMTNNLAALKEAVK